MKKDNLILINYLIFMYLLKIPTKKVCVRH